MKLPRNPYFAQFPVVALALVFLVSNLFAQLQGGFNPDVYNGSYSNITTHAFVVQADGKIVAASGNKLLRINPDGTKDAVLANNTQGNSMEMQADGKILVGLSYYSSGASRVLRLNADGTPDASFNCPRDSGSGSFGYIHDIAIAPDGDIYIADEFGIDDGVRIVRLNPDGSIDPAFARITVSGTSFVSGQPVEELLVEPDGKLVVGGAINTANFGVFDVFRANTDGTRDDSFVPPNFGNDSVHFIIRQPDGKFVVGGTFTIVDGQQTRSSLIRLNSNGSIDQSFAVPNDFVVARSAAAVQSDGKIVVANALVPGPNGLRPVAAIRLNSDGTRDLSFNIPRNSNLSFPTKVGFAGDGRIYLSGQDVLFGSSGALSLVRLSSNGKPELPFARYDYDGDQKSDLAVFRPSNGLWYVNTRQTISTYAWGVSTDIPVPADYDGDTKTDIAVFRPSDGTWYVINSSDFSLTIRRWGESGDVPIAGNIAWDRKAPFTIYRPSNSTWYMIEGTTSEINVVTFGNPGDIPLHGRYTNDAPFQSSLAVYRPSTSTFVYQKLDIFVNSPNQRQWGSPGDVPVSGDFDGDFMTDIAVYRPGTGEWIVRLSSNQSTFVRSWGQPGDIPVAGDYDGDQVDDTAIFRPSTGQWFIWASTEGIIVSNWGADGDIPAPGAFLP